MTSTVPPYLDAMLAAHAAGRAGRSIHLGYWPPGPACETDGFLTAQARLDDLVIDVARLADGLTALDVACGLGGLLATIDARFRGMDLTGVNHDPRQLDACHRLRPRPDTALRWVEAGAGRLPFAAESFDRVFCVEAMFHFDSRDAFLREAYRVLRADGRLVVTDILLHPPTDVAAARAVHADLVAAYGPWPEPWSTPGRLGAQVAAAGFADIELTDLTSATLPSYRFLLPDGVARMASLGDGQHPDPLGRSLGALQRLHASGNLSYVCLAARRPACETPTDLLVRTVAALGVPLLCERSLRITASGVGGDRLLLSLAKASLGVEADAAITSTCRALGMPNDCIADLRTWLPVARHVHFGFEGGPGPSRLKVYLEFPPDTASGPGLLHLAFKWDPVNTAPPVVTRYVLQPPADRDGILRLIARLHEQRGSPPGLRPLAALLDRVLARIPAADVQVLEVVEDTGRRSYDVNLADAGLSIADVRPELEALGASVGAEPAAVAAALLARSSEGLGHVAGGVHRDGRGFVTIYHGGGPWPLPLSGSHAV